MTEPMVKRFPERQFGRQIKERPDAPRPRRGSPADCDGDGYNADGNSKEGSVHYSGGNPVPGSNGGASGCAIGGSGFRWIGLPSVAPHWSQSGSVPANLCGWSFIGLF